MRHQTGALLAAVALLLGACGSGVGNGGIDGSEAADGGFVGMLGLVPDTPGNRASVMMEDMAAVREALAIPRPADPTDSDELIDYLMTITQGPIADAATQPVTRSPGVFLGVFMGGGSLSPFGMHLWPDEMGFSVADLDADLVAGLPPETLTVWTGSLDSGRIATAVATDPVWSGDLREKSHAGSDHWCWGDDPARVDVERRTPMRPLGRGGCLAAFEGTAYRTITAEAMEAALEARAGTLASLADVDALRSAAAALDDAGAYAAALTMDAAPFSAETQGFDAAQLGGPSLGKWSALGAGAGLDESGEYLVIVLVYDDDATAAANAAVIEEIARSGQSLRLAPGRPWSEAYDQLDSVAGNGSVVVARFDGLAITRIWTSIVFVPDSLTMWDD